MTHALLIARQEFIKYVTRRGFWLSILMFPVWILIVILVPKWTADDENAPHQHTFTIVDRAGGEFRGAVLGAMARHAGRGFATPWIYMPPPPALQNASERSLAPAVRAVISDAGRHTAYLDTVIVIPAGFGKGGRITADIWSVDRSDQTFHDFIAGALTEALRLKAVHRYAPQLNDLTLLEAEADVALRDPSRAGAQETIADRLVPVALAVILFVVSVMNSSVLLQGVVEEKSTRMIEVLLSCATPGEITSGKLIGVIAVALTTLLIWAIAFFVLVTLVSQDTAALILASLRAVASIDALPLLVVYFLCGLLIYGSLFLAIGSMAASLADAQTLLGPSMLILMLPNLLIAPVMHDPGGPLATALSWVPIYTPFFMMLRISSHPPAWQLLGTAALALATTAGMIVWTGRIFARHVLTTERPPSLGALVKGMLGRG